MKKILLLLLVCLTLMTSTVFCRANDEEISVKVNGKLLDFGGDQPPVIVEDRTLVPMRKIAEELGCEVRWKGETQTAIVSNDQIKVAFRIDYSKYQIAVVGQEGFNTQTLDVPAQLINDRTMIPLRALTTAWGARVAWDETLNRVYVITPERFQYVKTETSDHSTNVIYRDTSGNPVLGHTVEENGQKVTTFDTEFGQYSDMKFDDGTGFAVAKNSKDNYYEILDRDVTLLTSDAQYQEILLPSCNDEFVVKRNGKWGVLGKQQDGTFREVVPCKFDREDVRSDDSALWVSFSGGSDGKSMEYHTLKVTKDTEDWGGFFLDGILVVGGIKNPSIVTAVVSGDGTMLGWQIRYQLPSKGYQDSYISITERKVVDHLS